MSRVSTILFTACALAAPSPSCMKEEPTEELAPRSPTPPKVEDGGALPPERTGSRERKSSGRVYVPTYSHIYGREGGPEDLAVTLSVRNVSTEQQLVLESVRYYDTSGKFLEDYLESPAVLQPLETVEFFIPTQDRRGGSGANVVASWHADSPVVRPLIEAVMVRSVGTNQAYAFSTRGIEIPAGTPLPEVDAEPSNGPTPP